MPTVRRRFAVIAALLAFTARAVAADAADDKFCWK